MNKQKSNYRSSQQELYAVCKLAWEGCNTHLDKFQNFSPNYNPEFIRAKKEEITTVAAIPDSGSRSSQLEILRVELKEHSRICLDTWLRLKRYIVKAYPESVQSAKLKAAGKDYYRDASSSSWEACQGLLNSAELFIAAESGALLLNNSMPATFPEEFNSKREKFEDLYLRFLDGTKQATQKTDEKLSANNRLYDTLMDMMLDGQEIFRHDEVLKRQFMFDHILLTVSGQSVAGFKGTVTTGTKNGAPIEGALLTLSDNIHTCTTNDEGWYQFSQLPSGTYSVDIKAPGFQPLSIDNIEIKTGNMSNLHVQMLPEG